MNGRCLIRYVFIYCCCETISKLWYDMILCDMMWFPSSVCHTTMWWTADPLRSCNQSFAEEVAQGLLKVLCLCLVVRARSCARLRACACVCVFHSVKRNTPLLCLKPLRKQVWLYLKAWPGRETQTTVCSNISGAAADYYEFYYCLRSDIFQKTTLIKRFTLLSAVGGKNISYHRVVNRKGWWSAWIGAAWGWL